MQITQVDLVQETPQQFTANFTNGGQYTAEALDNAQASAAADPYQDIL